MSTPQTAPVAETHPAPATGVSNTRWTYGGRGMVPAFLFSGGAICAETDPESFFPEKGGSTREAKIACSVCPLRLPCLAYALDNNELYGVWGGLSPHERKGLTRPQTEDVA